jgi:hypothetical protein
MLHEVGMTIRLRHDEFGLRLCWAPIHLKPVLNRSFFIPVLAAAIIVIGGIACRVSRSERSDLETPYSISKSSIGGCCSRSLITAICGSRIPSKQRPPTR